VRYKKKASKMTSKKSQQGKTKKKVCSKVVQMSGESRGKKRSNPGRRLDKRNTTEMNVKRTSKGKRAP